MARDFANLSGCRVYEHTDFLHFQGQLGDYLTRGIRINVSGALLVKDKTNCVSTSFHSQFCVFEVCCPANLDPSHKKTVLSSRFSVFSVAETTDIHSRVVKRSLFAAGVADQGLQRRPRRRRFHQRFANQERLISRGSQARNVMPAPNAAFSYSNYIFPKSL